ncbi:arginine decarboxylase [Tanacetum coccineum]
MTILPHDVAAADVEWTPSHSSSLYKVDGWGAPYFAVNDNGNVTVKPHGHRTMAHQEIDLLKVVKKASDSKDNGGLGLGFPIIVRFPDVLKDRLECLQAAFNYAVKSNGFNSHYQGVYPVKCNQDRFVVEDVVKFGSGFRFGLEAGSKPELLLAMSSLCKGSSESLLICNGFKDSEYISLALIARKLKLNTVIVLEQEEELDLVIDMSVKLGVRPVVGVRAKLRTKHSGHFGATSGEKGKFGLTTTQIIRVVKKLDQCGMLDCFQLLHFHIGSQIPNTGLLADGVREASQIYCELVRLGADMKVIDIGGGLGIDYDGSKSSNGDVSVEYGLEEYAMAVVQAVKFVCDRNNVKHPVICSESGRAIVSHHSVLIFEAVSSSKYTVPAMSAFDVQHFVERLPEVAHSDYANLSQSAVKGDYEGCLLYADQLKERCVEMFKDGSSWIIEQLTSCSDGLCELIFAKANECPAKRGILSDLTCDSDGKIDKFIGGESSLPLHELEGVNGMNYYLGMFLGGAYEEALGGVHNLFGGPSVVRVSQSDGPFGIDPEIMFETLKHRIEEYVHDEGNIGGAMIAGDRLYNGNNGYYYCSSDEDFVAGPDAVCEDEPWSYVCA